MSLQSTYIQQSVNGNRELIASCMKQNAKILTILEEMTKPDSFRLVWCGEIIESDLDLETADILQNEYNIAYGGGVIIELE